MSGSYELYAEVLRRAAVQAAEEIDWTIEPSRAQFLPDSVASWPPFREANAALDRLRTGTRSASSPTSTTSCSASPGATCALTSTRRHCSAGPELQARQHHLRECARRLGGKKGWVHIASGYETDVGPALKLNVPTIWVNRHGEKLDGRKAPDATVKNVREAAAKLGAK